MHSDQTENYHYDPVAEAIPEPDVVICRECETRVATMHLWGYELCEVCFTDYAMEVEANEDQTGL